MESFSIFYRTSSGAYRHVKDLELPEDNLSTNEILDVIFYEMQGDVWSPHGEARELIKSLGLSHASMSIGDAVIAKTSTSKLYGGVWLVGDGFDWHNLSLEIWSILVNPR
jgi:hypothetical protein